MFRRNRRQPAMAMPAPAPTVAQPNLSDAITQLKAGDRSSAEAMMRQIVGLPPTGAPQQGLRPAMQPYQPGQQPMDFQQRLMQQQPMGLQQRLMQQQPMGLQQRLMQQQPMGPMPPSPQESLLINSMVQPGQMAAQLSPVQQQAAEMGLKQQAMQQQLAQQAAQMEVNKRMAQQAMQGDIGQLGSQQMVNPYSSDAFKQQFLAQQQLGMGNGMDNGGMTPALAALGRPGGPIGGPQSMAELMGIGPQPMQQGIGQLGPQPMVNPQSNDSLKQQFLAQQGIFQPMPAYQDPRQLGRTMEQAATAMMQPQQSMGQQAPFGGPQQAFGQTAPFGGPQQSQPSGLGSGGFGTAQTPAMTQQPQPAQQPAQQQPAQQGTQRPQGPFGRLGGASGGRSGLF